MRKLHAADDFELLLPNRVYALESPTIDLYPTLFPVGTDSHLRTKTLHGTAASAGDTQI